MFLLKFYSFKLFTILLLFLVAGQSQAGIEGDTIRPLPRINKTFQVVLHIVNTQDSVPVVNASSVSQVLDEVSAKFAPIGVSFTICETRNIYNFQYLRVNSEMENELISKYNVPERINLYYVDSFFDDLERYCGNASLGGIGVMSRSAIFIKKICNDGGTLTHEMGHYFNLLHTFEGSGIELADGSNCKTAGDLICDTPADPFRDGDDETLYINNNCLFISSKKDAKGNFYDPDVANIMSYYGQCYCGTFTRQQYERMAYYYLNLVGSW